MSEPVTRFLVCLLQLGCSLFLFLSNMPISWAATAPATFRTTHATQIARQRAGYSTGTPTSSTALIDLDVQNVSTRELLRLIADRTQQNFLISDQIDDTVTLCLKRARWADILQTLLKFKGLYQYKQNNIVVIVTAQEALERQQELLVHKYFDAKYMPVERLLKTVQESGLLSSLGKAAVDTNSNSLLVSDRTENMQQLTQFITHLDRPVRQIVIEARIVSVDSSVMRDLGLELMTLPDVNLGALAAAASGGKAHKMRSTAGATSYRGSERQNGKNTLNFTLAKLHDFQKLDLKLSALEHDGLAQVISKPKLITTDHQAASIETGAEIPYQETNKDGYVNTVFKKAVLSLTVTPELITNNHVNLNIVLNQDKVGVMSVNGQPSIDTRKLQTQVIARNDQTVVLGGIYEWSSSKNRSSIPIIGELPIINLLFSRDTRQLDRRELLIFVTPHIVQ